MGSRQCPGVKEPERQVGGVAAAKAGPCGCVSVYVCVVRVVDRRHMHLGSQDKMFLAG